MYTVASIPRGVVAYGSRVKLVDADVDADEPIAYEIVFPEEVDAAPRADLAVVADRPCADEQDRGRRGRGADARRAADLPDRRAASPSTSARRRVERAEPLSRAARRAAGGRHPRAPPGSRRFRWPIPCRARGRGAGTISQCQWNSAWSLPSSAPACSAMLYAGSSQVVREARQRRRPAAPPAARSASSATAPKSASCVTAQIQVSYGYAEANGREADEVAALRATTRSRVAQRLGQLIAEGAALLVAVVLARARELLLDALRA